MCAQSTSLTPEAIFERARVREIALSRLLIAYVSSGIVFMLLPGTFLGVWNLLQISGRKSAVSASPAWLQAHGHAQIFGWIGSFILGIGFYSVPKLRNADLSSFRAAWVCWVMWTVGVASHWAASVYAWHWRSVLPASSLLELAAFLIFFRAVSQHRTETGEKPRLEPWIFVVISAAIGFLTALLATAAFSFYVAWRANTPALPEWLDERYLALITWGFLVPFVWGFSARWMPVFLGLKPTRFKLLFAAVAANFAAVVLTLVGYKDQASLFFVAAAALAIAGLRMFEPSANEPKTRGVHASFPYFVRIAYFWLLMAPLLGVAAWIWDTSGGIWGASRHALTVGFIAVMVLSVGQRVLPAFSGMRLLWSRPLMFAALALLTVGCILRVSGEVIAYQGYASWAWSVLPVSAVLELTGITAFAANILGTFLLESSRVHKGQVGIGIKSEAA